MTTVVAWLALLVSVSSLGWQIAVWKKSTHHVVVDLQKSTAYHGDEEEQVVAVVATNVGRMSTMINEVGISHYDMTEQNMKKVIYGLVGGIEAGTGDLPKRLEPGEEFRMSFDAKSVWWSPGSPPTDKYKGRSLVIVFGYVRVGRDFLYARNTIMLEMPSA